jgi:hypothetical protein
MELLKKTTLKLKKKKGARRAEEDADANDGIQMRQAAAQDDGAVVAQQLIDRFAVYS